MSDEIQPNKSEAEDKESPEGKGAKPQYWDISDEEPASLGPRSDRLIKSLREIASEYVDLDTDSSKCQTRVTYRDLTVVIHVETAW